MGEVGIEPGTVLGLDRGTSAWTTELWRNSSGVRKVERFGGLEAVCCDWLIYHGVGVSACGIRQRSCRWGYLTLTCCSGVT